MKRLFSFLMALALLLAMFPVTGHAAGLTLQEEHLQNIGADLDLPDNDTLFAAYADQVLHGTEISTFGTAAGRRLSGDSKLLYNALVPVIRQIAAGSRSNTVISAGKTSTYNGTTYTPDVGVTFTGGKFTDDELMQVLYALLCDYPYEMYWFDKTQGVSYSWITSSTGTLLYFQISFYVAGNYSAGTFAADTTKTAAAANTAAKAQNIVSQYASADDYGKLLGYSNAICGLVEYDHNAAAGGYFSQDDDPWQLIHVFDGDPTTNVVCEGYSKAYMYLCDLSSFSGNTACYTVGGYMNGGAHMWNVVTLGGANYLVDVTNSESNTVGYDGSLFLAGGTGSPAAGYSVAGISYVYDELDKALWGTGSGSILTLSSSNYSHQSSGTLDLSAPVIKSSVRTATGKPKISWDTVDDADFYRIYRASSKDGEYSRIKSTSSTSYVDTSAKVGKNYYYKVKAVDEDTGRVSKSSNTVNRVCDLKKPVVTMKVDTASGKPKLTWEDMSGAIKYRVYRATSEGGSYTYIKTTTSTAFIDTTAVAGRNYYYKVKALHTNSAADSAYSDVVNRVCDLAKPVVSGSRTSAGTPKLTWDKISGAEKYYIYRATSKSGTYKRIGTAKSVCRYYDSSAVAGKTYYYKVKAIHSNTAANSAYSSVKSITAK